MQTWPETCLNQPWNQWYTKPGRVISQHRQLSPKSVNSLQPTYLFIPQCYLILTNRCSGVHKTQTEQQMMGYNQAFKLFSSRSLKTGCLLSRIFYHAHNVSQIKAWSLLLHKTARTTSSLPLGRLNSDQIMDQFFVTFLQTVTVCQEVPYESLSLGLTP